VEELSQIRHGHVTVSPVPWPKWLVDLLLPSRCAACGRPGSLACEACRRDLVRITPPLCARCGAPTAWPVERCRECSGRRLAFASARSAVTYTNAARPLVRAWKERGLRPFAALAAELVAEVVPRPAADVIAYIPPDGDRSALRGHHPAGRLAEELGELWSLERAPLLLRRARAVARQTGLSQPERRRNVRGAFAADREGMAARIVLVDDVYTTGATAGAGASALRAAGARAVHVVTFARAVR
jgi:predicted amidophosphoribosyltransferase